MTVFESLPVALFCFSMVFSVLACLCLLIKLFSMGISLLERKKGKVEPAIPFSVPSPLNSRVSNVAAGSLRLMEVDEPTAAMIMAIVSDESGIPLSELNFKSIKLIHENNAEGR